MSYVFPRDDWVSAYKDQINSSQDYRQSAADWEAGDVCFVVRAKPEAGLPDDHIIWLDLYRGECRDAQAIDAARATDAKFVITASYDRWKKLLRGELDPVKAMMMGQIKIRGNLGVLMRYTKAAKDLMYCGTRVPTIFLGD